MNALQTGIDAQSQIIPGEDPEALERLTAHYYDRFQPQGPEEVALIDSAISADWFLRRFRRVEAEMWNRSISREVENQRKWGKKPEQYPLAAAFLDQQKAIDRLQRRISAAKRSLRASLETLARLRKVGQRSCRRPKWARRFRLAIFSILPATSLGFQTFPQLLQIKPHSPKLALFLKFFPNCPRIRPPASFPPSQRPPIRQSAIHCDPIRAEVCP
jgi:hypothetical protein